MPNPPYISGVDDFKYLWLGTERVEFSEDWDRPHLPDYDATQTLYSQHGGEFHSIDQMDTDIAAYGLVLSGVEWTNGKFIELLMDAVPTPEPLGTPAIVVGSAANLYNSSVSSTTSSPVASFAWSSR